MDVFTKCGHLKQNSVLLARHFQCKVEMFFRVIFIEGSLGKIECYAICFKFQVRGSSHVY